MSYEPEMIPDMEHIDQRPSPIKKQKEKVTFVYIYKNYYYFLFFLWRSITFIIPMIIIRYIAQCGLRFQDFILSVCMFDFIQMIKKKKR